MKQNAVGAMPDASGGEDERAKQMASKKIAS